MDAKVRRGGPLVQDLLVVDKVLPAPGTVDDIDGPILLAAAPDVVDDRAERREADAAGDEEKVLAEEVRLDREAVAIRPADRHLLARLHLVEPVGHTAAPLDRKFQLLLVRRRRGDREQRLAHAGDREHRALSGDVEERLLPVQPHDAEGLDIRRVLPDARDDADLRDQRVLSHFAPSPSVFATLTMFMEIGHWARHRPQPTQP